MCNGLNLVSFFFSISLFQQDKLFILSLKFKMKYIFNKPKIKIKKKLIKQRYIYMMFIYTKDKNKINQSMHDYSQTC